MPKSNRKTQLPKKLRSESPPPELEDAVAPEFTEGEASAETPTPGTYVVSEADTASGTSSATEDNFIRLSLSFQLLKGRPLLRPLLHPVSYTHLTLPTIYSV